MNAECRWCGPVWVPDDLKMTVEFLHAHAMSDSHLSMMRLDRELDAEIFLAWGRTLWGGTQ